MKWSLRIAGLYLAFLAQSLIFEKIDILSCSPDILLVAVIICSISASVPQAGFIGAGVGILKDALYGRAFGLNILMYMYLAIIVSMLVNKRTENSPLLVGWVCFASITLLEIVTALLKVMFAYNVTIGMIGANVLVKGVIGSVFAIVLVALGQYITKRRKRKKLLKEEASNITEKSTQDKDSLKEESI